MVRIFREISQRAKDAIGKRGKGRPLNINNENTFGQTPEEYSENRGYGDNVMNEEQLSRDLINLEGEKLERAIETIAQYTANSNDSSLMTTFYKIADKHRILSEELDIDSEKQLHFNLYSKYQGIADGIRNKVVEIIDQRQRQAQTPPQPNPQPPQPSPAQPQSTPSSLDNEALEFVNNCYIEKSAVYIESVANFKLGFAEYNQKFDDIDQKIKNYLGNRTDLSDDEKLDIIDKVRIDHIKNRLIPTFGKEGLDFINNTFDRSMSYYYDLCQMIDKLSTYQTVTDEFATKYEEFQDFIRQIKPIAASKGVDISYELTAGVSADFKEGTIGNINKKFLQPNVVVEIINGALLRRSQAPNQGTPAGAPAPQQPGQTGTPAGAPAPQQPAQPGTPAGAPAPQQPAQPGTPAGAPAPQQPGQTGTPAGAPAPQQPAQPGTPAGAPAPQQPAQPGTPAGAPAPQQPAQSGTPAGAPAPTSSATPDSDLLDYQAQVDHYNSLVDELNILNTMIATTTISDTFSEDVVTKAINQEQEAQEQENILRQQRLELSKQRLKYVQTHHKYIDVNAYKLAEPTFGVGMTLEQSSNIENDLAMRIEAKVADLSQEREINKDNQIAVNEKTRQISLMVSLLEARNSYMSRRIVSEAKENPNFNLGEFLQNRLNERKEKRALLRKAINGEVVDFQTISGQTPPAPGTPTTPEPSGEDLGQPSGNQDLDKSGNVKIVRFQLNPNPNLPSKISRRQATIVQSVDPVTKAIAKNKIKIQFSSGLKEALKNLSAKLSIVSKINPTQEASIAIDPTADSYEISTPDGSDIKDYEMQISVINGDKTELQYQKDLEDIVSKARTR